MYCKADFEEVVSTLKRRKRVWTASVCKEFAKVALRYFNTSAFRHLPSTLLVEIFLWLPNHELLNIASVSTEWYQIARSNDVWMPLFRNKFVTLNPNCMMPQCRQICYMSLYQKRLMEPVVGDKVEVAWKGKFRLETQDVYQGLAWWTAEIVDKNADSQRYKIHYPGWESRWDEWVPRSRLRWIATSNDLDAIHAGDIVELWCCGQNVPGAWLECKVKRVRDGMYCLGRVLSSGYLWVDDRSRLRLVSRDGKPVPGRGTGGHYDTSSDSSTPIDAVYLQQPRRRSRLERLLGSVASWPVVRTLQSHSFSLTVAWSTVTERVRRYSSVSQNEEDNDDDSTPGIRPTAVDNMNHHNATLHEHMILA